MPFAYCPGCEVEISQPTIEEDLLLGNPCSECGMELNQHQTVEEWVVELWSEFEDLKKQLRE